MQKQSDIGQCVAMSIDEWTPEMIEGALEFKAKERERIKKNIESQEGYTVEEFIQKCKNQ